VLIISFISQPVVDGPLTLTSYLGALESSYSTYKKKYAKRHASEKAATNGTNGHVNGNEEGSKGGLDAESFDYILFHS